MVGPFLIQEKTSYDHEVFLYYTALRSEHHNIIYLHRQLSPHIVMELNQAHKALYGYDFFFEPK